MTKPASRTEFLTVPRRDSLSKGSRQVEAKAHHQHGHDGEHECRDTQDGRRTRQPADQVAESHAGKELKQDWRGIEKQHSIGGGFEDDARRYGDCKDNADHGHLRQGAKTHSCREQNVKQDFQIERPTHAKHWLDITCNSVEIGNEKQAIGELLKRHCTTGKQPKCGDHDEGHNPIERNDAREALHQKSTMVATSVLRRENHDKTADDEKQIDTTV
ncbi:hypothetical protein X759_22470 [Mesorhizobium sp. LSHC420B00]|nr:hypothetical protein X759_22470 [Mesorhizobium sp. LSHC420B00]